LLSPAGKLRLIVKGRASPFSALRAGSTPTVPSFFHEGSGPRGWPKTRAGTRPAPTNSGSRSCAPACRCHWFREGGKAKPAMRSKSRGPPGQGRATWLRPGASHAQANTTRAAKLTAARNRMTCWTVLGIIFSSGGQHDTRLAGKISGGGRNVSAISSSLRVPRRLRVPTFVLTGTLRRRRTGVGFGPCFPCRELEGSASARVRSHFRW
jgi:hypothetical protein